MDEWMDCQKVMPLCGLSCKLRLGKQSVNLKSCDRITAGARPNKHFHIYLKQKPTSPLCYLMPCAMKLHYNFHTLRLLGSTLSPPCHPRKIKENVPDYLDEHCHATLGPKWDTQRSGLDHPPVTQPPDRRATGSYMSQFRSDLDQTWCGEPQPHPNPNPNPSQPQPQTNPNPIPTPTQPNSTPTQFWPCSAPACLPFLSSHCL